MKGISRCVFCLYHFPALVILVFGLASASVALAQLPQIRVSSTGSISLPLIGDLPVLVPKEGEWYSPQEYSIALRLVAAQSKIDSQMISENSSRSVVSALEDAKLSAAHEMAEGVEFGRSTSSVSGPQKKIKLDAVERLLKWIDSVTAGPTPNVDAPETRVSVSPDGEYALHYKPILAYVRDSGPNGWTSYTFGEKLLLGLYVFRVHNLSTGSYLMEEVSVWDQPTARRVNFVVRKP